MSWPEEARLLREIRQELGGTLDVAVDEAGIINVNGNRINPATEETVANLLTESTFTDEDFAQDSTLADLRDKFEATTQSGGTDQVRTYNFGIQPDGDLVSRKMDGVAFEDTNALGANETFTSDWFDTDGWRALQVFIATEKQSANDGILLQFTDDANVASPTVRGTIQFDYGPESVERGFEVIQQTPHLDGVRVKYENGGTAQDSFYISLTLHAHITMLPQKTLSGIINESSPALIARSVQMGKDRNDEFQNSNAESLNQTFNNYNGIRGVINWQDRALQEVGNDQWRVDIETNNSDILDASDQPFDVSAAEVDVDIASQTLARIIGELELEDAGGTGTYANIHRRNDAIQISIENDQTSLLKSSDQPFDVSAATVTITDDGNFTVSSGPLDGSLASQGTDELRVNLENDNIGLAKDSTLTNTLDRNIAQVDGSDAAELINEPSAGDRRYKTDIEGDNVGLAKDNTLNNTLDRNIAQVGGTTQSGEDIANILAELGDALVSAFAGDDELRTSLEADNVGLLQESTFTSEDFAQDSTLTNLKGQFDETFMRIKEGRIKNSEERRDDIPNDLTNDSIYLGIASDGASTANAVWDIVRIKFDGNGLPEREQIREGAIWDNRDSLSW